MHNWGDKNVDWNGISDAAEYIGDFMVKWGRIVVSDTKEKWGTARVYCQFGWYDLHSIFYSRYHYIQWKQGSLMWRLNYNKYVSLLVNKLGELIVPYQKYIYYLAYKRAVGRWPHLRKEILISADYPELLTKLEVVVKEDSKGYQVMDVEDRNES